VTRARLPLMPRSMLFLFCRGVLACY